MRKTTTFLYGKLVFKITEFIEIKKSKEKDYLSNILQSKINMKIKIKIKTTKELLVNIAPFYDVII